ncbi:hypothetical protein MOQ72_27230 [Saccharopolyspora sp. K220]|uniref:DUF6744 family protein n=1 Tax=Saccharopolyspora soli TaxID=2926618 RepID=UPI001F55FD8C|nr:DUF6744 family protein [Saccharopolyspora soli]MCI2421142.1 hypothetical protein [Saccharopolyspora soli]
MAQPVTMERENVFDDHAAFVTYADEISEYSLLGYVVMYSIFDGKNTHQRILDWVRELGLDPEMVPEPTSPAQAFRRVTGPTGVKVTYPKDDPSATGRRSAGQQVTLMIREVSNDRHRTVKRIVREEANAETGQLEYESGLGEVIFRKQRTKPGAPGGAGKLHCVPNPDAIASLHPAEQQQVADMFSEITRAYRELIEYIPGDRLRGMIHDAIEKLGAVSVRPTGGVYFVPYRHKETLAALRELVRRFGPHPDPDANDTQRGSRLTNIPLPRTGEMREEIIDSFRHKARTELTELTRAILEARASGDTSFETKVKLHEKLRELQRATAEHESLLAVDLSDTSSAQASAEQQLRALFEN